MTLEASVFARSVVTQTIELFNYDSGAWEEISLQNASRLSDATVEVVIDVNAARFIHPGSGELRAEIGFLSPQRRQRFTSHVDHFSWTIDP